MVAWRWKYHDAASGLLGLEIFDFESGTGSKIPNIKHVWGPDVSPKLQAISIVINTLENLERTNLLRFEFVIRMSWHPAFSEKCPYKVTELEDKP